MKKEKKQRGALLLVTVKWKKPKKQRSYSNLGMKHDCMQQEGINIIIWSLLKHSDTKNRQADSENANYIKQGSETLTCCHRQLMADERRWVKQQE